MEQVHLSEITLDLDSTVITRSGQQEGSAKGDNPMKRGRNSHHPLMAFISQTRMVANAWVRPGNTADSSNCEAFLQETLPYALAGQRVGLLRADSGFYTESILNTLASESSNYLIAARLYPHVKRQIDGLDC